MEIIILYGDENPPPGGAPKTTVNAFAAIYDLLLALGG